MILYIDTSSSYLYTGILENGKIVVEIKKEYDHELSRTALPEIVSMFENNAIEPKEINKIIVVNGPGSFTGIRIGITIAKVYAWSLKVPITTITSLEAMAASSKNDMIRIPIIDARRGYCYASIIDQNDNFILKPIYIKYEELKEKLKEIKECKIITNDKDKLEISASKWETYDPNIEEIVEKYKYKKEVNPHAINPEYLKLTEAEESKQSC